MSVTKIIIKVYTKIKCKYYVQILLSGILSLILQLG